MISFLIKYKKAILIVTLAFFIGSIVYIGLDSYRRGGFNTTAARVGSADITYKQLYKAADAQTQALRNQGLDVEEDLSKLVRQQALSALISEEVLNQAAAKAGLAVADYEIAYDIQTSPMFAPGGQFNRAAYEQALKYSVGMTPAEFEEQLRRSKTADRFRTLLYSHYKLTPEEVKFSYQVQNGNLKKYEENKKDFAATLLDTKMQTAQKAFFDRFNEEVEIKTFLQD